MSPTAKLSRAEQARPNGLPSGGLQADPGGATSHGSLTPEGKARSALNSTRHGLRAGPFSLCPGEDTAALTALHRCVAADWRPRDAYEHHWVGEVVAALWRANRLRRLEIEHLDVALADPELALAEATVKKLATYARYGARLDADLRRALGALRVLKERPDARVAADAVAPDSPSAPDDTREPAPRRDRGEPEPPPAVAGTDPAPRLNRKARRRQQALLRKAQHRGGSGEGGMQAA